MIQKGTNRHAKIPGDSTILFRVSLTLILMKHILHLLGERILVECKLRPCPHGSGFVLRLYMERVHVTERIPCEERNRLFSRPFCTVEDRDETD
jgi:hypothetical protein